MTAMRASISAIPPAPLVLQMQTGESNSKSGLNARLCMLVEVVMARPGLNEIPDSQPLICLLKSDIMSPLIRKWIRFV